MESTSPTTASDAEIARLFGIKRPFHSPLYLSYPLNQARRLSADEAAQLCERDSAIKPTSRDGWEIAPVSINGIPHAALSKMTARGGRHSESTWHLPLAPGEGMLRLTEPLGSGRALSQLECRQLRSIGGEFKAANPAWTVKPSQRNPLSVEICRYRRDVMLLVCSVNLAMPVADSATERLVRAARPALTALSLALLKNVF